MAYNPDTNDSDYTNCVEHRWPQGSGGSSHRSIGSTSTEQCNCCLAMRISWSIYVRVSDDEWVRKTEEKVIEPSITEQTKTVKPATMKWCPDCIPEPGTIGEQPMKGFCSTCRGRGFVADD